MEREKPESKPGIRYSKDRSPIFGRHGLNLMTYHGLSADMMRALTEDHRRQDDAEPVQLREVRGVARIEFFPDEASIQIGYLTAEGRTAVMNWFREFRQRVQGTK